MLEPIPGSELVHTQVVKINDSLRLRFLDDDAVGSQLSIGNLKKAKTICESVQTEIDSEVGVRIGGFMTRYFERFGFGWRDIRINVASALKKREAMVGIKRPHEAYATEADNAVTKEIELPFYEMLSKNPVESLHFFQGLAEQIYRGVGESGLKSQRDPEAKKLVFFLEVICDLQENLEGAPARKQQYLYNLRQRIGQSLSKESDGEVKDVLTGRVLPVLDRKIEEFRQKATMMGEQYAISPRQNRGSANRPIEDLLGSK